MACCEIRHNGLFESQTETVVTLWIFGFFERLVKIQMVETKYRVN